MTIMGMARRNTRGGKKTGAGVRLGGVVLAALAWGGCSSQEKTGMWAEWEYTGSDALGPSEQVQAQRAVQSDYRSITGPYESRPTRMFSDTLTEQERRKFQRRHAEAVGEHAEAQADAAEQRKREVGEAQRTGRSNGSQR